VRQRFSVRDWVYGRSRGGPPPLCPTRGTFCFSWKRGHVTSHMISLFCAGVGPSGASTTMRFLRGWFTAGTKQGPPGAEFKQYPPSTPYFPIRGFGVKHGLVAPKFIGCKGRIGQMIRRSQAHRELNRAKLRQTVSERVRLHSGKLSQRTTINTRECSARFSVGSGSPWTENHKTKLLVHDKNLKTTCSKGGQDAASSDTRCGTSRNVTFRLLLRRLVTAVRLRLLSALDLSVPTCTRRLAVRRHEADAEAFHFEMLSAGNSGCVRRLADILGIVSVNTWLNPCPPIHHLTILRPCAGT
jgi:hypothetical protein